MTPYELTDLVEWIEDRWPGTRNFRNVDRVAHDFAVIPHAAAQLAAEDAFKSGSKYAPTLSELRREAARIAHEHGMLDPSLSSCDTRGFHGVFVIDTHDTTVGRVAPAMREATCVECGLTVKALESKLLTVGEQAATRNELT
jgi:hypothetical protein